MGHLIAKEAHRRLRERLDKHSIGAPDVSAMYEILKTVYTEREAAIAAQMPMKLMTAAALAPRLKMSAGELERELAAMAEKGLVFDFAFDGPTMYMLAPTMVGFFEFSMMRLRADVDQKKLAGHYHDLVLDESFTKPLIGLKTQPLRVLPHESALPPDMFTEVCDYERATHVIGDANRWAVGLCYCRHIKHHVEADCKKFRMECCMTIGAGAEWTIRHGLAREISRQEALDLIAETRDAGLVHMADNVQRQPTFMCNCCGCCCEMLLSFKKFDDFEPTFSSNFLAGSNEKCTGCGKCAKACPVEAIDMVAGERVVNGKRFKRAAKVDEDVCIGCGVCKLACKFDSLTMKPRAQRRITPENTFKRMLSAALETDKLHHLLIEGGEGMTWRVANQMLGAILKLPPTKRLLLNQRVRSRFLDALIAGAKMSGVAGTDM